jgi:hypothetical protein
MRKTAIAFFRGIFILRPESLELITMKPHARQLFSRTPGSKLLITAILVLIACNRVAYADDAKPDDKKEEPKPKKWESVITAGATLTRGNSKNFLATISLGTKRTWSEDEALLGASAGYGENQTTVNGAKVDSTTDSYVRGFGQWNHLFTPRIYAGVRLSGEHDDIADLTYRFIGSPLAGYYFIKETNALVAAEFGPSYVREKFFSQDVHDYIGLRLAERGEYKFSTGAKIWESFEYIPKVEDFGNYLVTAEAGVSAPVSKALSVSLVMQDTYKSVPATGKLKNDFKLIAGLSYNF